MDQAVTALSFIGFAFIGLCLVTGAFVWLRWGWTGVAALWRFRQVMDATVREDFDSVVRVERNS